MVNCGHAPPLLVRESGTVVAVEPAHPAPPLGLRALTDETPSLQVLAFADGDQLLLYTDGVTEARNHSREFYPLAEGLARHVSDEPACTLTALHDELLTHVGGRLHDDAALLLLRKPAASTSEAALPEAVSDAGRGCGSSGSRSVSSQSRASAAGSVDGSQAAEKTEGTADPGIPVAALIKPE